MGKRLTEEEIAEIENLLLSGMSQTMIAIQYNVDQSTISKLKDRLEARRNVS